MLLALLFACRNDAPQEAVTWSLTDAPYTALQAAWRPLPPSDDVRAAIAADDLVVTDLEGMLAAGLGVALDAGQPWQEHAELAPGFTPGDPDRRRSLLYAWQAADPQLIDEESPIRMEAFTSLYRPQGHLTVQVFEAHVRTAQRLSDLSGRPFDLALFAGDLTDGSQLNEGRWFLDTLAGGIIDPDSGADDDPVAGAGNDFNDPFISDGLSAPWYAVIGNHETQYNGGFGPIDEALLDAAVGGEVVDSDLYANGFRDGATPTAEVVSEGTTPADPDRVPLGLVDWLDLLASAEGQPSGHGLTADDVAAGRGWFSDWPLDGAPIRLIALNTVNPTGDVGVGSQGWMDEAQHAWLLDELTDADRLGELVIVMSHHRVQDFTGGSPVSGEQVAEALASSPSVVLQVTGHGHQNHASVYPESLADAERGYWQLMLASTIDFPMQSRVLELVDEGNGYLTIYATNLGHNATEDSLAHLGRQLAAAAMSFGGLHSSADVAAWWEEDRLSQNLALRLPLTEAQQLALAAYDWPTRVESEQTLLALDAP